MPWLLIAKSPWTWVAVAFTLLSGYAAVQHIGWQATKAEYAQFRADVETEAAKAKVRNAQIQLQHAQAAQEALDDLTQRHDTLSARYASLRARSAGSPVSSLPGAAQGAGPVPGGPVQSDPDARCLAVLEKADGELAKYAELWELQQKNARQLAPQPRPVQP